MQRKFITNLALVLVLNLLVKPFYILGIDAEVQVRVGSEAYGVYAALLSLSFLFNIVLDMGVTNWNTRQVAQDGAAGLQARVGGILLVRGGFMVAYFVVLGLVALLLGYGAEQLHILAVLALNQALAATLLYLRSNIAGLQRFAQDSLLSVLDRALLIGICIWLLWGRGADVQLQVIHFAWAQTVAYALAVLVAARMLAHHTGAIRPRWDAPFVAGVVRQSLPYALLVLLMSFYYRTDTVMLERMLPDGALQAGIYAQGFRFFEALNMFGFLLAGLLLPMFSKLLKEGGDAAPLAGLATRLVWCGGAAVALLCTAYAPEIMALRYHEHTAESAPVFTLLVWGFVAVCITYVHGTLLTAAGALRSLNRVAAMGMVGNIALNLLLIPRYQAMGAAAAGLLTQGLTAVAQWLLSMRRTGTRPQLRPILGALAYFLVLAAAVRGLQMAAVPVLTAACIALPLALGLAFATGSIRWAPVRALLQAASSRGR